MFATESDRQREKDKRESATASNKMVTVMASRELTAVPSLYTAAPSASSFRVKNIDDKGRIIHTGFLEIFVNELIFRYEHHPQHETRWPLSCIRRYGINLEGNVFAFEAGRRAPEGEGIFAFRTEGVQACEIRQRVDYYTTQCGGAWTS